MSGDIQTQNPGIAAGGTGNFASATITNLTTTNVTVTGTSTLPKTDTSGTPGNATINTMLGRCAIAAAAASVVITSSIVTATSRVMAIVNQAAADTTLTQIVRVSVGAGTFTIFGNAAATAAVVVDFVVYP